MKNQEYVFNIDFNKKDVQVPSKKDEMQSIVEENLKIARTEGYAAGLSRGLEEGRVLGELGALTKSQKNGDSAFVRIYEDVHTLVKQEYVYDQELTKTVMSISETLIKKVFPHYVNKYGCAEMEQAIRYILSTLLDHQDISIFLSPNTQEDINARIADIQSSVPNKIIIHCDEALKEWECRVEWKGGGARWSQPDLLESIQGLFTQFVQSVELDKEARK